MKKCLSVALAVVLALSLMQMSIFGVDKYMLTHSVGLLNTLLPAALEALFHPAFVTLLIVLAATRPLTVRQTLMTAGGGAVMAGMVAAGDWLGSTMYTNDQSLWTLALHIRQMSLQGMYTYMASDATDTMSRAMQAEALTNGGVALLAGVCLIIGVIGVTLLMMGVGGSRVCREELYR